MPELGISLKFIRQFDAESAKHPTQADADMLNRSLLRGSWIKFMREAPNYDPAKHDTLIADVLKRL